MDVLQFTLFFAALFVGYVLLHVRVARFEGHLEKLASLRSIDDRLRQIDDRLQLVTVACEGKDGAGCHRLIHFLPE